MYTLEAKGYQSAILQAELKVSGNLDKLCRIRDFIRGICEDFLVPPLDEEGVTLLEMAVNEAMSNIVVHALPGSINRDVFVEISAYPDHISVLFRYFGKPFSPNAIPFPSFGGSQTNGFGLYIMSKCTDNVRYTQSGSENRIHLIKKRKQILGLENNLDKEADTWN